jgi:hypothetical protein
MKQLRLIAYLVVLTCLTGACGSKQSPLARPPATDDPPSASSGLAVTRLQRVAASMTRVRGFHFVMTTTLNDGEVFRKEGDLLLPDRLALQSQIRQPGGSLSETQAVYIGDTMWFAYSGGAWTQGTAPVATWRQAAFSNGISLTDLGARLQQVTDVSDLGDTELDGSPVRHMRMLTAIPFDTRATMEAWIDPQTNFVEQLVLPFHTPSAEIAGETMVQLSKVDSPEIRIEAPTNRSGSRDQRQVPID